MTVVTTIKIGSENNIVWVHMAGTIAEVLQEMCDQGFTQKTLSHYSDGGTNAIAVGCRRE